MKRYRVTMLAISLVLIFLGTVDIQLFLKNTTAQEIGIVDLIAGTPHKEKMLIRDGYLDLKNAISTSGSIEIEALLVPLTIEPGQQPYKVFVETRSPEIVSLIQKYNFEMDTEYLREKFYEENKAQFYPQKDLEVMQFSSIVANNSQVQLARLVKDVGLDVDSDVVFVSEGKEPPKFRGYFFLIIGALGLMKTFTMFKNARQNSEAV